MDNSLLATLSVKELRSRLTLARINHSHCVEKSELVALLQQHSENNNVADDDPTPAATEQHPEQAANDDNTSSRTIMPCSCCNETKPDRELLRCGGCRQQFYCSKACQKAHWKQGHREPCKLMQAQQAMRFNEAPQLKRFESLFRRWEGEQIRELLLQMTFAAIYSNPDPNCTCDSHYVFIRLKMEDNNYLTIADWDIGAFDELRNTDPETYLRCTNTILEHAGGGTKCLTLLVYIHPDEEYGSVVPNGLHRTMVYPVLTGSHTELKEKGRGRDTSSGYVRVINQSQACIKNQANAKKEEPDAYKASKIVDKWMLSKGELLIRFFYSALFHRGEPFDRSNWVLVVQVRVDVRGDGRLRVLKHSLMPLDYFRTKAPWAVAQVEQAWAAMSAQAGGTRHAIYFDCKNDDAGTLFSFARCQTHDLTRAEVARFGHLQTPQEYQKELNQCGKDQNREL